jgi:hypothetical protein
LAFFDGYDNLPLLEAALVAGPQPAVLALRMYPKLRMYGGDAAVPWKWFTVKAEAAYLTSPAKAADDYVQYVVQLERLAGEWSFTGGYAGEAVTKRRALERFAPTRGFTRALLGRAGYTIDARRSVAVEAAVRQTGEGSWVKAEYSQSYGQHWRVTASGAWTRGEAGDFLGQYRRNSNARLVLRYSF